MSFYTEKKKPPDKNFLSFLSPNLQITGNDFGISPQFFLLHTRKCLHLKPNNHLHSGFCIFLLSSLATQIINLLQFDFASSQQATMALAKIVKEPIHHFSGLICLTSQNIAKNSHFPKNYSSAVFHNTILLCSSSLLSVYSFNSFLDLPLPSSFLILDFLKPCLKVSTSVIQFSAFR